MRRNWQDPEGESAQSTPRVIDLTDAADQVPPEDYPVLVLLRDQLVQAREVSEQLRQELAVLQDQPQTAESTNSEVEVAQLRNHYEQLLDDEQGRRSELQASLESERLLRMKAETKIEGAREELKQVKVDLRSALKNERARAVEARKNLAKVLDELVHLKANIAEPIESIEKHASGAGDQDKDQGVDATVQTQNRKSVRNKRSSSSSPSSSE